MFALMSDEELKEAYGYYRECLGEERGIQQGLQQGTQQRAISDIKTLMKNLNLTAEQAMQALGIPECDYDTYMKLI